jgi:hypothetical protein
MRALRVVGLSLVVLVALAFVAFGIDDVLMNGLPPVQQAYAERHGVAPSDAVVTMVLSVFAGQGGFFFGSGLALLLLAAGPLRRRDRFAAAAALALIVFGNAGIILALHRLGSPFRLLVAMLVLGAAGVLAAHATAKPAQ